MPALVKNPMPNYAAYVQGQIGVYWIYNVLTDMYYIGSTAVGFRRRLEAHRRELRGNYHDNQHLQNAWNKYGAGCFKFEILEICSPDRCLERETFYISFLGATERGVGYNMAPVGGSMLGYKHSEEFCKRISEVHKGNKYNLGRKASEETRQAMSRRRKGENNPRFGKEWTVEAKAKLSKIHKGKIISDAHKAALSRAHKGRVMTEEVRQKIRETNTGKIKGPPSAETRAKIAASHLGKKASPEAIANMKKAQVGRTHTEETKAKISALKMGFKHSEETKRKMSESKKGAGSFNYGKPMSDETKAKMVATKLRNKLAKMESRVAIRTTMPA